MNSMTRSAAFFKAGGSSRTIGKAALPPKYLRWGGLNKPVPHLRASSSGSSISYNREDSYGNGDWIKWLVIDLTGQHLPRKAMHVRQYIRENDARQNRAIMGGFERDELEVVIEYGFVIIRARHNPAVRNIDPPLLDVLFEMRFLLPRNACTRRGSVTAQAADGVLHITIPKKKSGDGVAGNEEWDHPVFVPVTGLFPTGV